MVCKKGGTSHIILFYDVIKMEKLACKISKWGYQKGYYLEKDIDSIRFGVEVILSQIIVLTPTFIYTAKKHNILNIMIMLIIFGILRIKNEGYHAKTLIGCFILTNIIMFCSIYASWFVYHQLKFLLAIMLIIFMVAQSAEGKLKLIKFRKADMYFLVFLSTGLVSLNHIIDLDYYMIYTATIFALLLRK